MFLRSVELLRHANSNFERYPFSIPSIKSLDKLHFESNITCFVGENGHFASHLDTMPESLSYYGGRSLHEQSHGEAFFSLFKNRFGKKAIYLLDEPEAALSPARQLAFLRIIHDLSSEAQFIIATHSPILLGYPKAQILNFDDPPIQQIRYEDTMHYMITKRFVENRTSIFRELFHD